VHIHCQGAVDSYRPLAASREYVLMLEVSNEQVAGAEIIARWRKEGSRADGQARDPSTIYLAQPHIKSETEVSEVPHAP
jgi:hypothetical protein